MSTSNEDKDVRQTWDVAWKIFFDPSKVWCRGFVVNLLGDKFADYFVNSESVVGESERVPTLGADKSTDSLITFIAEDTTKQLLTEFQSYDDHTIACRVLDYALSKGKLVSYSPTDEDWDLPEAFIVNVRKHSGSVAGNRGLHLKIGDNYFHLHFPVVNAFEVLPEIQTLIESEDSLKSVEAVYSLYAKVTKGMDADLNPDKEFLRACALISASKAYEKYGVSSQEVDNMVFEYDESRPTVLERIEARGARKTQKEIIVNLMKLKGWTKEETISF